jgi:hypothetical protein
MKDMIQLRPPADADNYRVKAGRFGDRFYTDPLPADGTWEATGDDDIYPAISTVKKATGQDWSRAMAKRLAKAPSQLVEIGNLDSEFERKARLNLLSDAGLDQASGRGTIVHQHAEATLMGRLPIYQMSDVVKPYIARLEDFLAAYNPTLVAAEFVAINRKMNEHNLHRGNKFMGYGGTGDAVVEIDGKLYLVDWKSRAEDSDHKAYAEEGAQVSAYGRADYWIVGCDESINGAKRIAPLDLAGGLIVSIKPDSYECFPIDLDEGFAYWTDLHAWWQARRSETRAVGRKWAPRVPTSQLATGEEPCNPNAKDTNQDGTAATTPTDADTATSVTETSPKVTPTDLPADTGQAVPVADPPTRASNRERFDALPEIKKGWAREAFKRKGVDPRTEAYAGDVARILADIEQRPTLREAQETRAEQMAAHTPEPPPPPPDPVTSVVDLWEQEGGEAPGALIAEARLLFDMVIGAHGRQWTGFRVTEANDAGVPFLISALASMKRAHLYLALTTWAAFRGEVLESDEAEGNIEFASILFMVDGLDDAELTLGYRLGSLTAAEAERLAAEVAAVVQSETGEQPLAESETTNNQTESE